LILDICRARSLDRIGEREIRLICAEAQQRSRPNGEISPSYVANVLRQAGKRVEYNDPYVDPWMEEPYASRLQGVLQFHDFESAEASLQKLDEIYREYREVSDRLGTGYVRELALKGKQRAESLAANPRVSSKKRSEKQEIAHWFKVWLDVSDLFFDWVELRKQSEEFQQQFPNYGSRQPS
jgi:hypothetical protein